MKSQYAIYMDFKKAKDQADQLDALAKSMNEIKNTELQNCIAGIGKYWTGDNADAFLAKVRTVQGKIGNTADDLTAAASTIRQIAKQTYDAEMAAYKIAMTTL